MLELRAAGFTLDELGELPLRSWIQLYGAARARYWDDKAVGVSVVHPQKPREAQKNFMKAARQAFGAGDKPVWTDVKKMKAWLGRMGVSIRERKGVSEGQESGAGTGTGSAESEKD